MKQTVKISLLDEPLNIYKIEKEIYIKEMYMLQAEQVTDGDIQRWIDYGLGMPVRDTGFGEVWYEMVNRELYYALTASKAHSLNASVCRWWANAKSFTKSLMRV